MTAKPIESAFEYCPQCGNENGACGSVPFRCPECGFAHFFGPVAAVGALVINEENELLLVRRARDPGKGKWGLPGGFVDRNETVEEALIREAQEEIGLQAVELKYLMSHPNHYTYRGITSPVIDLFYLCRVVASHQIRLAPDELDQHLWVRPNDSHLDQMAFHSNRIAIERWLSQG